MRTNVPKLAGGAELGRGGRNASLMVCMAVINGAISAATPPQHFHTVTVMCGPKELGFIYLWLQLSERRAGCWWTMLTLCQVMSRYVTWRRRVTRHVRCCDVLRVAAWRRRDCSGLPSVTRAQSQPGGCVADWKYLILASLLPCKLYDGGVVLKPV